MSPTPSQAIVVRPTEVFVPDPYPREPYIKADVTQRVRLNAGARLDLASIERQVLMPADWIAIEVEGNPTVVHSDDVELVAVDRAESDPCQLGTKGCCVDHVSTKSTGSCQPW